MLDLSVVLLTFGLAAAIVNPAPPTAPQATPPVAQTEVRINQVIAPAHFSATQPAALLDGEQASKTDINYTPHSDEQTWHFDAQGNPADQASAGGYYRKSLGKTADGRLVVQDYYQDSGKPQTAPFILKENANPHDFSGDNSDSKTVWYRKDGSLDAIQDYRDGKPFGRLNIYDDGRLVAQFARDDEQTEDPADPYNQLDIAKGIRLYYPSGNIMAFIDYEDDERAELYYREDGSPFLATLLDSDGKIKEITSWDKNGGYLADGPDEAELDAIDSRRKALLTRIANLEFMGGAPAESALPKPAAQPALLPESVLDAKQASKISIDYTAESDGKTWYFDRDGKPVTAASAGGYYRKSLGKTADGRLVAQDYYQDSNTPQTAPFILMKDADPHNFSNDTVDSKIVWYKEDGSVSSVVPMRGGKPQGRQNYYQNGRLIAQSALPDGVEEDKDDPYGKLANDVRYYHENGHILYLQGESAIEPPYHTIIYDPAGTPLAGLYLGKNPDDVEVEHFSDTKEAQDALHAALERRKAIRERIFKEDEDGSHKTDTIDLPAPAAQPGLHPESLLDAKQATAHAIDYQADSENQIWYFDVHGNPTDKASAGGYYRKSLGKTADGRLVAQDYYQDSDAPQTAPFALVKDANPHNFDNDIADSKIIWYRKDGSTYAVQTFKDGKPTSRMNIYENGRLVAQSALPAGVSEADDPYSSAGDINNGMRYYYPSGHLLALEHYYTNQREEILYDNEGKPLFTYRERPGEPLARWNGMEEHHPEQGQALEDAYTRREQIQQMIEATAVGSADKKATSDADGEKAAATATNPLPCEAGEGGGGGVKTRAATATDCSQPTELPLPPVGEGGDGVSPQPTDDKAGNATAPAAAEGKADAEKATPSELPPSSAGEGGDGVSAQATDAKTDNATNPLPCEAGEGGGVKTRSATATDCSQPTELPLPPVGEGGDGVSPQAADAKTETNGDRKYNLGLSLPLDSIQPDSLQAPAAQTARLPENLLDAKQAAENPIDYTPATAPDLYADRDGKPSEQPTPGGFTRKTLGKTADGRLVVQDYYQDSGTPQTAPLTLKKDADPRDFTTAAVDGKAVWYSTAGDILAIQQYQNGAPVSRLNYYHAGRLAIQSRLPQGVSEADDPYSSAGDASKGERYYYQNGQLLALDYDSRLDPNIRKILYDENGQPLAAWRGERTNDIVTTSSWNTLNNTPAAEQTARRQTFDAALARKAELQKLLHAESELNAPADGDKAPSATPDSQPAPSAAPPTTTHNHTGDDNVALLLQEPAAHPDSKYNLHPRIWMSAGIEPDSMAAPPALPALPASEYDAAEAAKTDITYTPYPQAEKTYTRDSSYSTRKILGETADGRLVIQDYYANSDQPRTAPYILNKYGDKQDAGTIHADSKLVWYRQDGSVYAVQRYHAGHPAGHLSYYQNGRLIAQHASDVPDPYSIAGKVASGTRYYDDDGHILALEYHQGRVLGCGMTGYCEEAESLYAPDGSPLAAWHGEQTNDIVSIRSWNSLNTTPAAEQAARRKTFDAALTRWEEIKQDLNGQDINSYYESPNAETREPSQPDIAAALLPDTLAAPADLPAPTLAENVLDAKQAAENPIDYTPLNYPDHYADRYGKPTRRPVHDGYIRKILGKTADGRLVAQDYRKNDNSAQTAPFTLKKDADPRDFTTDAVDGKLVWHNPDGSVRAVQQYQNGAATSPLRYYHEGRLAIQYTPADRTRYYHPNGQLLAVGEYFNYTLYDDQGKPLVAQTVRLGHLRDHKHWDSLNNTPAEQQRARRQTYNAAIARGRRLHQMLQEDGHLYLFPNIKPQAIPADDEKTATLPAPPALPAPTLPENLLDAKQAAENPIDYTPATAPDLYADRDGKPSEQPTPGGFIRKTLGKTADGRLVVQDYYQDSGTPQTAPLTLKKDADPRDFSTDAVDGKLVWYAPDGDILAIQQYQNGEAISPLHYYHEGRLAIATPQPGLPFDDLYNSAGEISRGLRYYHKNGQILALERENTCNSVHCKRWQALYDDQGQPLFTENLEKHGCIADWKYWNAINQAPEAQQMARYHILETVRKRQETLQGLLTATGSR